MPILSVNLRSIRARVDRDRSEDEEVYVVIADAAETAKTIRATNNPDLPKLGADDGSGRLVLEVEVERDANSRPDAQVFLYRVVRGTPEFDPQFTLPPLQRPPEISWEGLDFQYYPDYDLANRPFRNSAGQLLAERPAAIVSGASCLITRNEAGNPASLIAALSYSVNAAPWHGVAAKHARLGKVSASKQFENGYVYWRVSYPVDLNRHNWRFKAVDKGFWELKAGKPSPFVDEAKLADGTVAGYVTRQVETLLNGAGAPFISGPSSPFVLFPTDGFQLYEELDWTSLNLPNPFA